MSNNWKNAERSLASTYQYYGIPAHRVSRGMDFSKSTYDVKIEGADWLISDSKYTKQKPFRFHGILREIEAKYCKNKGDVAILSTRNYKERGEFITIRSEFFAKLLSLWLGCKTKAELEALDE